MRWFTHSYILRNHEDCLGAIWCTRRVKFDNGVSSNMAGWMFFCGHNMNQSTFDIFWHSSSQSDSMGASWCIWKPRYNRILDQIINQVGCHVISQSTAGYIPSQIDSVERVGRCKWSAPWQYQWQFQEPKLEVTTIYKAYVRPISKGYAPKIWPTIWYSTSILGSWNFHP